MRALPIVCVVAVALVGCAVPVAPAGGPPVEERIVGGKAGTTLAGKGNPAGGSLVAAGAGNLVAAGAGNLAAGSKASAGIVAAGAGNVLPDGEGRLADNGNGLVAAGGGNFGAPAAPLAEPGGATGEVDAKPSEISAPRPAASTAPSPQPSPSPSPSVSPT